MRRKASGRTGNRLIAIRKFPNLTARLGNFRFGIKINTFSIIYYAQLEHLSQYYG